MDAPATTDRASLIGYAIGVGLVFVATLGVYWRFWQPGTSVAVWAGGSFLIGAAVGAGLSGVRAGMRRARSRGGSGSGPTTPDDAR
jgi:hypothetical protein